LLNGAGERSIRVILDLVVNPTSDEHPWFQSARTDRNSPFRDWYVWSDTSVLQCLPPGADEASAS
jgi:maltose alpha-D-glucosyltransferase / alpha-amylase